VFSSSTNAVSFSSARTTKRSQLPVCDRRILASALTFGPAQILRSNGRPVGALGFMRPLAVLKRSHVRRRAKKRGSNDCRHALTKATAGIEYRD
jgi:hypothetical protein